MDYITLTIISIHEDTWNGYNSAFFYIWLCSYTHKETFQRQFHTMMHLSLQDNHFCQVQWIHKFMPRMTESLPTKDKF